MLRHKRLRHRTWWRALTKPLFDRRLWSPCRDTVASGLAIGFFFAMMLMPFQMIAAALVAMRFRVNIPFAIAGCWVSNMLTHIPVWVGQELLGDWMRKSLGFPMPDFLESAQIDIPDSWDKFYNESTTGQWMQHTMLIDLPESLNAASFLLGTMVSGILLALMAYPIVHLFAICMPHHLPVVKKASRRFLRRNPLD